MCYRKGNINKYYLNAIDFFPYLLLIIITGFRYNVGTDYQGYAQNFYLLNITDIDRVETTFKLISAIGHFFGFNQQFVFLVYATITYTFIYLGVRYFDKQGENRHYIILFILIYVLFNAFNTIRQMAAVAIFFYALRFAVEKKLFKYIILIFIASLFHKSAYICFIFYFLQYIKGNKLLLGLIISPIFLYTNLANKALELYIRLSGDNWYSLYLNNFNSSVEILGGKIVILLYFISIFYALTMEKMSFNDDEKYIIKIFICYGLLLFITLSSIIASRILYYPMVSLLFVIPILTKYFKDKKGKLLSHYLVTTYAVVLWINTLIHYKELFNDNGLLKYTFRFLIS